MRENKIQQLIQSPAKNLLSLYVTGGYPSPGSFLKILDVLMQSNVDLVEIGIPFSDPMADGPIIRTSHETAIKQGITLSFILQQLKKRTLGYFKPIYLMGYLNPFYHYGMKRLLKECADAHVSGLIIPDLPPEFYVENYKNLFKDFNIFPMFLVSPTTPLHRLEYIYSISTGPVYMVTSHATTGNFNKEMQFNPAYLHAPHYETWKQKTLLGFGIHDRNSFKAACRSARGGIIGSAFIQMVGCHQKYETTIPQFIENIRGQK